MIHLNVIGDEVDGAVIVEGRPEPLRNKGLLYRDCLVMRMGEWSVLMESSWTVYAHFHANGAEAIARDRLLVVPGSC